MVEIAVDGQSTAQASIIPGHGAITDAERGQALGAAAVVAGLGKAAGTDGGSPGRKSAGANGHSAGTAEPEAGRAAGVAGAVGQDQAAGRDGSRSSHRQLVGVRHGQRAAVDCQAGADGQVSRLRQAAKRHGQGVADGGGVVYRQDAAALVDRQVVQALRVAG